MKTSLAAIVVCAGLAVPALAQDEHPADFNQVIVQTAKPEDMVMFQPYIGTFRGKTYTADSGTEYYFTITYEYYNRPETVVKFTLATHLPGTGEARPLGEGFYYFDREAEAIRVMGVFKDGRVGAGYMTPYDARTGKREVRIVGQAPDGTTNQVRDTFEIVSDDSWRNVTFVADENGDWQKVSEDIYTRVKDH